LLVNAGTLALICMEWIIKKEIVDLEFESTGLDQDGLPISKRRRQKCHCLYGASLCHMPPRLGVVLLETSIRHTELRGPTTGAFESGTHYAWALLAGQRTENCFRIRLSLFGLWIDSGSFEMCTEIIERMGSCHTLEWS
jgi:hypothetical protein